MVKCLLIFLLAVPGCIAQSHFAVDQAYSITVEASIEAIRSHLEAIENGYVKYKHDYQLRLITSEMDSFWARHTDGEGRAVSRDAEGNIVAMPVEQIRNAMNGRNERLSEVIESQTVYDSMKRRIEDTLDSLLRITIQHREGTINDAEAMSQAQTVLNNIIGASTAISISAVSGGI